MVSNSAIENAEQLESATSATRATTVKTSSPTVKDTVKPAAKPAVKPAVKPVAKPVAKSARTTEKSASTPIADKEATKKGESAKADKTSKSKKPKLVRDSFTMPESEYELIAAVKKRCVAKGLAAKKSEVLRAAIIGFAAKSDTALTAALRALEVIKTGRPTKE